MPVRRHHTFSLCAAAALLVLATADVCRIPPTRLFVRAPPSAKLVSCVDSNGDVLSACVAHCDCRELEHPFDQTSWGVCIGTLPTKPCLDPGVSSPTRRQCQQHSPSAPQAAARRLQVNGTAPASLPTTATTSSSSAASGSEMDRNTMIIVVACVVAVFAVVVVGVVIRTRKHDDGNADDALPTTPTEGGAYNEFTGVEISPQPTATTTTTTTLKPFIHRPSAAYSERTTLASNGRDSVASPVHQEQDHREDEDDEIAMLGSYIEPRAYNGNTFVSVVSFGEDDGTSSTGSTDVDALRSESHTMLSSASSRDWRDGDDDMLLESNGSAWSFSDAQEPPLQSVTL